MGLKLPIAIKVRTQSDSVLGNATRVLCRCLALLVWGLGLPFEVLATALASWGTLGRPVLQRLAVVQSGSSWLRRWGCSSGADLLHAFRPG